MKTSIPAFLVALFVLASAQAETIKSKPRTRGGVTQSPAPEENSTQFQTAAFNLPLSFFSAADPSSATGKRAVHSHVKVLPGGDDRLDSWDVLELLASRLSPFPPGSEAYYLPLLNVLIVKAPPNLLTQVSGILNNHADLVQRTLPQARITFIVAEFRPPEAELPNITKIGYSALRKMAGSSWKELGHWTAIGRTDALIKLGTPGGPAPPNASPDEVRLSEQVDPLGQHETGLRAIIQPIEPSSGLTVHLDFGCRYRLKPGEPEDSVSASTIVWREYPTVVQTSPAPSISGQPSRQRALIVSAELPAEGESTKRKAREGRPLIKQIARDEEEHCFKVQPSACRLLFSRI